MPPWALKWAVPYAGYLLAAIFGWLLLSAHERIGEVEAKLDTQAGETREAADANTTNLQTIADLRSQIATMIAAHAANARKTQRELEVRAEAMLAAQGEAERLRRERDELIRQDPTCEAHSRQVLADSCPAIAERLRERSRGSRSNPD